MPTYEYGCATCGTYEVEQRITEAPLQACPSCGAATQRLISRTSFALRGGGWHSDGYSKGSAGACAANGGGCGGGACGKPPPEA
jgi:putative FmdB family regulatory protein